MPFFSSGGFTSSTEGDTRGDQPSLFSELPQVIGAVAQSVTAVVSAIKGVPPPPIRVEADIGAGAKQTAAVGGGLILGVIVLLFLLRR